MAGLEPEPDYRDKEMSEAVGDFALHLYVYWSKKHSNEAERIGKILRDWDHDFYALLEPEEDPTQHLKDSKNREKVLNKLKELKEQHTAEFFVIINGRLKVAEVYKPQAVFSSLDLEDPAHAESAHLSRRSRSPHRSPSPTRSTEKSRRKKLRHLLAGFIRRKEERSLSHDDFRINHRQAARYAISTYGRARGGGLRLVPSSSSSSSSFSI